jgi:hypothetical protein
MVRKKNVLGTMMQSFAIAALVSVLWMVVGYSLAFSTAGMEKGVINFNSFIGRTGQGLPVGADDGRSHRHHPGVGVHDLPDDLRHHHLRPHRRCPMPSA